MSDLLNSLYNNKKTTYYYIHTEKGTYSATIEANPLTNSFCLYLGGTIKGCVIIFLEDYKNIDIAILDSIKYNSSCNITNTLEEGDGTKHMIFTALNILFDNNGLYLSKLYPHLSIIYSTNVISFFNIIMKNTKC